MQQERVILMIDADRKKAQNIFQYTQVLPLPADKTIKIFFYAVPTNILKFWVIKRDPEEP